MYHQHEVRANQNHQELLVHPGWLSGPKLNKNVSDIAVYTGPGAQGHRRSLTPAWQDAQIRSGQYHCLESKYPV